jgi:PRTRC genetic system protein E
MFKELAPLVAERNIHLVLAAAKDGKIIVYIEPAKKDEKEESAFVTPLRLPPSDPAELDSQLSAILTDWVKARASVTQTLQSALAESNKLMEQAAADAKKAAADKAAKKPGSTVAAAKPGVKVPPTKPAVIASPTPSMLDDDTNADAAVAATPAAPVAVADAVAAPKPLHAAGAPPDAAAAPAAAETPPAAAPVPVAAAVTLGEEGVTVELF